MVAENTRPIGSIIDQSLTHLYVEYKILSSRTYANGNGVIERTGVSPSSLSLGR